MDGNGRWARQRQLPRVAGHQRGVEAARAVVEACAAQGIGILTLFAFSSENWRRPPSEVGLLMDLFLNALQQEAGKLHQNQVRLTIIGDRGAFAPGLRDCIARVEELTSKNTGLQLVVAANYGGRWDITEAARELAVRVETGELNAEQIDEALFAKQLCLGSLPEPDLFIRTGGEQRISNFLLWQLAYTELYFTEALWPDFGPDQLQTALTWYGTRQRRFGRTGEQLEKAANSA
jgi:undecaprenyl diphosphate synthase